MDEHRREAALGGDGLPLDGVRVIDLSTSYAGPTGTMYLADLGADVIKVERPGHGDDARLWGPPFVGDVSAWFASANRNKRSIVLDIRSDAGSAVLHRLLEGADVFVESMSPSKLTPLGLDPDQLTSRYPRLIYCAVSGFGITGPDTNLTGYDLVAQARSGLMSVTGELGGKPQRVSTALSDIVTGMMAALAVTAALHRQRATGKGDVIDVSLLDSDLALMAPRIASFLAGEAEPRPSGGTDSVIAIYQAFETATDPIVIAVGNDSIWRRFCVAAGLADLAEDPRLETNALRRERRHELVERVAGRLLQKDADQWLSSFADAGVPAARVQSLSRVVTDAHVVARGSLLDVPVGSTTAGAVRSPWRMSSQPQPRAEPVPAAGEHGLSVLRELGYSDEDIAALGVCGAVMTPDDVTVSR